MTIFAKLYNGRRGQILVKLDSNEDGAPEIRYYVQRDFLGVSSIAHSYKASDKGWDEAEAIFEMIDEKSAVKVAQELYDFTDKM